MHDAQQPLDPHHEFSARSHQSVPAALAHFSAGSDASPQAILQREQREARAQAGNPAAVNRSFSDQVSGTDRAHYEDRTPPQSGIAPERSASMMQDRTANLAPDLAARSGINQSANGSHQPATTFEDRGIYAPAEAMRAMYDMGDAPSCATCGAIMTRSGSCYRCMSCGSTSGCS